MTDCPDIFYISTHDTTKPVPPTTNKQPYANQQTSKDKLRQKPNQDKRQNQALQTKKTNDRKPDQSRPPLKEPICQNYLWSKIHRIMHFTQYTAIVYLIHVPTVREIKHSYLLYCGKKA